MDQAGRPEKKEETVELCESLRAEHEVILHVLDSVEEAAARVEAGGGVEQAFFGHAIAFVREFADGVHHQKEEKILFPRMVEAGAPERADPSASCFMSTMKAGPIFVP